jgi:D-alanyl-D-alanine dipeptidase
VDFSALDDLIAAEIADKAIPSISYAVFDPETVLAERHASRLGALNADSVFRIGSISKTFAAILAMQLVEQGRLHLDTSIAEYLPGFDPAITLRKLLSHRAGLTREAPVGHYLDDGRVPLDQTVSAMRGVRPKAATDETAYFYSNAGFAVVGGVIEAVTGRPYAEQLQAMILDPLGVDHTAIAITPAIRQHLAPAQMWTADIDFPAPVFDLGSAPAGNIFATLGDAARYGQALLGGGRGHISPQSLAQMWAPGGDDPERGYGLGFAVDRLDGHRSVGHGGVVYGYASTLQLLPEAGLGVVMFATLDFTNELIGRLARRALRLALAKRGQGFAPRAARRLARPSSDQAAGLAGLYAAGETGPLIELRASGIRLTLIDEGVPLEIRSIGQGRFVLDGRIHGEETQHPFPTLEVTSGEVRWKGRTWRRVADDFAEPVPAALAPHLGAYGPDFNPTYLSVVDGGLMCLMEYFCPHRCEPLGGGRYLMHGSLYEREILELGVTDAAGNPAIRVGEMVLTRRGQ